MSPLGQSLFEALNPVTAQAILARCVKYRARRGAQPLFDTPEAALAYTEGWDQYPGQPDLSDPSAKWSGYLDRAQSVELRPNPVRVTFDPKPMPARTHDWSAYRPGTYEPGMPVGYGATEQEAIANLLDLE